MVSVYVMCVMVMECMIQYREMCCLVTEVGIQLSVPYRQNS